jgi:hypothetical protein
MSVLGFTQNRSNIKTSAITSWYMRSMGESSVGWAKYLVTFDNVNDHVIVVGAPFGNLDTIMFELGADGVMPNGLAVNTMYYMRTDGGDFKVSTAPASAVIDFDSDGSGTIYAHGVDEAYYPLNNLY